MKLQAIIGAGKGLSFDNLIGPEKAAAHILGLPFIKIKFLKHKIVYFTDSVKLNGCTENKKGKNVYISINIEDPQTLYRELSEKGYTLINSRIIQDCKLKPMPQQATPLLK